MRSGVRCSNGFTGAERRQRWIAAVGAPDANPYSRAMMTHRSLQPVNYQRTLVRAWLSEIGDVDEKFEELDVNGDGLVTQSELTEGGVDAATAAALIAISDADGESVLGSWVGARRLVPPFLIPHRAPRGFTQDPSTDYYAASQRWSRAS